MRDRFTTRLAARIRDGVAPAVVGLDPRPEALPESVTGESPAARIAAFYREVLPVVAARVAVVKPNIAFFEAHGQDGYRAYVDTCAAARDHGLLVIGDVKRGDIGSTAEAYAAEHFRHADALTLHPYLGHDSVEPFLRHCAGAGRAVFVLVRTSNPSGDEFQALETPTGTVAEVVATAVDRWGAELVDDTGYSSVGAVVGATYASDLATLRRLMPRAWLLIPGVGAQGGAVSDLAPAFAATGLGALVSQSRGILQCFAPDAADWLDRVERALTVFETDLRAVSAPS